MAPDGTSMCRLRLQLTASAHVTCLRKAFGSRSSEVDRHGSTIQLRSADQCRSQGPRSPQQKFVLINHVTDYINNTTKQRGRPRVRNTSGGQKLICAIAGPEALPSIKAGV